jgi:predicted Zn-dependent protease
MSRIEQLQKFLQDDPTDTFVLYSLAQEYLKSGDLDRGLDYFERLKQTDPDYVGMYYHLGKLQERLDQRSAAVQTYEEGIERARAAGDMHAASELTGALNLLRLEMDD